MARGLESNQHWAFGHELILLFLGLGMGCVQVCRCVYTCLVNVSAPTCSRKLMPESPMLIALKTFGHH